VLVLGTGRLYPGTIVRPEVLVNEKSQRPHGNETGDFPACSAVPQPTALPAKGYWPFHFSSTAGRRYNTRRYDIYIYIYIRLN
jgi:hypothetical protein